MNKNSLIDYLSCALIKLIGPPIRLLPAGAIVFIGSVLGEVFYCFDFKRRAIAYANIKRALGEEMSPQQVSRVARGFYRNFVMSILEIFLIPRVDQDYIDRHIEVTGRENIARAFGKGKGVILLGMHAGSWELSNVICANLGFPFNLFVRDQKMPLLNDLLNSYRRQKGCRLIQRKNQTRALIEVLKSNQAIGMTADQGGAGGEQAAFFGKNASLPTGALRIALRYGAVIVPAYYRRKKGLDQEFIFEPPFELKNTADPANDLRENLKNLTAVFEKNIRKYPQEYFWRYKIWKYSNQRKILILSDKKAGHLRQSLALAGIIERFFLRKDIFCSVEIIEVEVKNKFALTHSTAFSGKYSCQGCLFCLRRFLACESYEKLWQARPDIVISAGSVLAPVNYLVSRQNLARSLVVMRPSVLSTRRFDLVVMPQHDRPAQRKNIVVIHGAVNPVDGEYLKQQAVSLTKEISSLAGLSGCSIGILIGGDNKGFSLTEELSRQVFGQIKQAAQELGADILLTTSRRTPAKIEELIGEEFAKYEPCKAMIIANKKNFASAVGGILGLSRFVVVSPESISMISEAASSGKYVFVFNAEGLGKRHRRFLGILAQHKHIYLVEPRELAAELIQVARDNPAVVPIKDSDLVEEAISKIL